MSGHSKWNTIKRQKGVTDAKRGREFTKLGNAISIAVKEGGGSDDPAVNFRLRLVVDQARNANMPKENIARAIDRGSGKSGSGGQLETVTYEGYGPEKVAILIETVTDNRNRTSSEVRSTLEKNGGIFASAGSVSWLFKDFGLITINKNKDMDELFEIAVDCGAVDVEDGVEFVEIYTNPSDLDIVKKSLEEREINIISAQMTKKPTTNVQLQDIAAAKKVVGIVEKLEDLDDVNCIYANFEINDDILQELA